MNIYTFLNEIFFASFEALNWLLLFLYLTGKRRFLIENKVKSCIFILSYTIFSYWASTYLPIGYHSLIIAGFIIVSLYHITNSTLTNAFFCVLLSAIFFMLTEGIIFLIFSIAKHMNIGEIVNNPYAKFKMSGIIKISQLILIILIYKIKKTFFKKSSTNSNNPVFSYILLSVFLMGIFVFSINYIISSKTNIILYQSLFFFIFISLILLAILEYREKEQLLKIKHKFQLQEEYLHHMETIIDIVRKEKHDFANHINTIHAMCILNKPNTIEKIKSYLDKLVNNLHSSYHYYNSGNDYIDGLLAVKSNFAFNHDIYLDVDFEFPLNIVTLDDYNLISLLSNLIDNAFEAILSEKKQDGKVVSIYTYTENDNYYLCVANNGPMIPEENIKNIFKKGFSTKEKKKEDHGLGLYIIKDLIEKNNSKITVSSSKEETQFLIQFAIKGDHHGKIIPESCKSYTKE